MYVRRFTDPALAMLLAVCSLVAALRATPATAQCDEPGVLTGVWTGEFSGTLQALWQVPSERDGTPTLWDGEERVRGLLTLTIPDPSLGTVSTLSVRMTWDVRHHTTTADATTIDVGAQGLLRGGDSSQVPETALAPGTQILLLGSEWAPVNEGKNFSVTRRTEGGGVISGDGRIGVSPAEPLRLTIRDVTCDSLRATVVVPFWYYGPPDAIVVVMPPSLDGLPIAFQPSGS